MSSSFLRMYEGCAYGVVFAVFVRFMRARKQRVDTKHRLARNSSKSLTGCMTDANNA